MTLKCKHRWHRFSAARQESFTTASEVVPRPCAPLGPSNGHLGCGRRESTGFAASARGLSWLINCNTLNLVRFTWHDEKASSNARKHGVTFVEAATVFADPLAIVVEDAVHEGRTIIIGQSMRPRLLFTVFVELADDHVRIISARRATAHERKKYEEGDS